jgi:putative SOS response-associated peptidase YedK
METSPELRPYIEAVNRSSLKDRLVSKLARPLVTEGEVRPTDLVPVIAPSSKSQEPTVFPMVWGFTIPQRQTSLFNARVESATEKPTFKESCEKRRCIVPASWYYEWEHLINASTGKSKTGDKYMIQAKGSNVIYLAGLYRLEEIAGIQVPVFTILTREPSDEIRFIHDRMPVMLPKEYIREWVNPNGKPEEIIRAAQTEMVFEVAS